MLSQAPVPVGIYRHYKGQLYCVLSVARHSENEESLVVYRCLYGNYDLWVRPLADFISSVTVNGQSTSRFTFERPATELERAQYMSFGGLSGHE